MKAKKYSTIMKTEIKKILYKFLQDGITSDDAAQQVLDLLDVSGSLLKSLHQDLKGFQEMAFLTPDVKIGLGIAIEQVERYMRNELEVPQQ